jgi:UDP-2,3-diacylglucosamine pyrophosphatase LpxH
MSEARHYRTIWLSDIHLASRGCKAEFLLDFLKYHDCDLLYLVGDIIDGWRIRKGPFWVQSHNDVVQKLLRKARKGTQIFYLPGNHDEALRQFREMQFGGITFADEMVHRTADGKHYLVLHGDKFDAVVLNARWLALLGESTYDFALWLNTWFNFFRRKLGFSYWSLSGFLKQRTKQALQFITNFKLTLAAEAHRRGLDGVICGHLHHAELHNIDGVQYCNTGDWVENCTALVEHADGRLEIIEWAFTHDAPEELPAETTRMA